MTTPASDVPRLLSKRALAARGWTPSLVRDLLGEPDEREEVYYRDPQARDSRGALLLPGVAHLYARDRVLSAEARPEFLAGRRANPRPRYEPRPRGAAPHERTP